MTVKEFIDRWNDGSSTIEVKTSGSTGTPKTMAVEKNRMLASARITCDFLGLKAGGSALLCMPLDYIAGKMMAVRSIERNLRLIEVEPSSHPMKQARQLLSEQGLKEPIDLVAMVPLQVYSTLQVEEERQLLMQARHLLIGGGAIDKELENKLKEFPNAVWSTYGMTETLSHIALRRINGKDASEWYTPFENVSISQDAEGCLVINAPEVCSDTLSTNDIIEMNPDGRRFRIIGRRDNVICSGGIKIQIEEVEAAIRKEYDTPFMITKCHDEKFGEAVVMLHEQINGADYCPRRFIESFLPRYWHPRYYFGVKHLPMTETGKPARKEAERMAALLLRLYLSKDNANRVQ